MVLHDVAWCSASSCFVPAQVMLSCFSHFLSPNPGRVFPVQKMEGNAWNAIFYLKANHILFFYSLFDANLSLLVHATLFLCLFCFVDNKCQIFWWRHSKNSFFAQLVQMQISNIENKNHKKKVQSSDYENYPSFNWRPTQVSQLLGIISTLFQ